MQLALGHSNERRHLSSTDAVPDRAEEMLSDNVVTKELQGQPPPLTDRVHPKQRDPRGEAPVVNSMLLF